MTQPPHPTTIYSAPDIARESGHGISSIYAAIKRLDIAPAFATAAGLSFFSPQQVDEIRRNMAAPRRAR